MAGRLVLAAALISSAAADGVWRADSDAGACDECPNSDDFTATEVHFYCADPGGDGFWDSMRREAEMAARHFGVHAVWHTGSPEEQATRIRAHSEGTMVTSVNRPIILSAVSDAISRGIKVFVINSSGGQTPAWWSSSGLVGLIMMDDVAAGRVAAEEMIALGVRLPCVVDHGTPMGGDASQSETYAADRWKGFSDRYAEEGLSVRRTFIGMSASATATAIEWEWEIAPEQQRATRELLLGDHDEAGSGEAGSDASAGAGACHDACKCDGVLAIGGSSLVPVDHVLHIASCYDHTLHTGSAPARTVVGVLDDDAVVREMTRRGKVTFGVSQRAFLQGYVSSALAAIYVATTRLPSHGQLLIDPQVIDAAFLTSELGNGEPSPPPSLHPGPAPLPGYLNADPVEEGFKMLCEIGSCMISLALYGGPENAGSFDPSSSGPGHTPTPVCAESFDVSASAMEANVAWERWDDASGTMRADWSVAAMCNSTLLDDEARVEAALQCKALNLDETTPALNLPYAFCPLPEPLPYAAAVSLSISVLLLCGCFGYLQWSSARKIRAIKQELESFKDSVVGMRWVPNDWDLRAPGGGSGVDWHYLCHELGIDESKGKDAVARESALVLGFDADGLSSDEILLKANSEVNGDVGGASAQGSEPAANESWFGTPSNLPRGTPGTTPKEASGPPMTQHRWYWQEDAGNLSKHNPADVKDGYVAFVGSVCRELDEKFHKFTHQGGPQSVALDLNDRIGSTGTEAKAHNAHTGAQYYIDFGKMIQTNAKSKFDRQLRKESYGQVAASPPPRAEAPAPKTSGTVTVTKMKIRAKTRSKIAAAAAKPSVSDAADGDKPADLVDEPTLILFSGQLLQISKQRLDGWVFGSVVLDTNCLDGRPASGAEGFSSSAGWFPMSKTNVATAEQMGQLQKVLGGSDEASDALKPPTTWEPMKDPMAVQKFPLPEGAEKEKVVREFMKTLNGNIKVQSVERIQSMSMWQSYAVKRQTILMREEPGAAGDNLKSTDSKRNLLAAASARFERFPLFHGTDEDTVPKIITQGFNRSFCGKNATVYGKGVYFARDASYSSSTTYSRPNGSGVQHMMLCRVVVGQYCLGKRDALTPDVRKGHLLYDSTVNNMNNPGIYVSYHDAQAYPEYLVKFKQ